MLAGGASRRFGSDKLGAELAGRPLVVHAIEPLLALQAPPVDEVIVVAPAPPAAPAWLPAVADAGVRIVRDRERFGGPLSGLTVGLGALAPEDVAVVLAGDMPRVDPASLDALVRAVVGRPGVDVACLAYGREPHPLPLAVAVAPGRRVANDVLARGGRSLRAFLDAFGTRSARSEVDPRSLVDVDTPDDLARLGP